MLAFDKETVECFDEYQRTRYEYYQEFCVFSFEDRFDTIKCIMVSSQDNPWCACAQMRAGYEIGGDVQNDDNFVLGGAKANVMQQFPIRGLNFVKDIERKHGWTKYQTERAWYDYVVIGDETCGNILEVVERVDELRVPPRMCILIMNSYFYIT